GHDAGAPAELETGPDVELGLGRGEEGGTEPQGHRARYHGQTQVEKVGHRRQGQTHEPSGAGDHLGARLRRGPARRRLDGGPGGRRRGKPRQPGMFSGDTAPPPAVMGPPQPTPQTTGTAAPAPARAAATTSATAANVASASPAAGVGARAGGPMGRPAPSTRADATSVPPMSMARAASTRATYRRPAGTLVGWPGSGRRHATRRRSRPPSRPSSRTWSRSSRE